MDLPSAKSTPTPSLESRPKIATVSSTLLHKCCADPDFAQRARVLQRCWLLGLLYIELKDHNLVGRRTAIRILVSHLHRKLPRTRGSILWLVEARCDADFTGPRIDGPYSDNSDPALCIMNKAISLRSRVSKRSAEAGKTILWLSHELYSIFYFWNLQGGFRIRCAPVLDSASWRSLCLYCTLRV